MTDPRDLQPGEGMTLIGRVGNRVSRFVGSGFLVLENGIAYLKESVPLSVRQLWHSWTNNGLQGSSTISEPLSFPLGVVANKNGKLFGIRGLSDRHSVHVWNFEQELWETWPISALLQTVSRQLSQTPVLELTGFDPVPAVGDWSAQRSVKSLGGEGIVILRREVSPISDPLCDCPNCSDSQFTTVAEALANPIVAEDDDTVYHLAYSRLEGHHWVAQS